MKILVTSFGPFNNFKVNPSNQVMEQIKQKVDASSHPEAYFEFQTIDVSWNSVSKFIESKKNETYDFILHLGVASNESNIRIETKGQNFQSGHDIENSAPNEDTIIENESNIITNISLEILKDFVSKKKHIKISDNAGSYLCNYLYYKSLYYLSQKSLILFIHVADTKNQIKAPSIELQSDIIYELIYFFTNKTTHNSVKAL